MSPNQLLITAPVFKWAASKSTNFEKHISNAVCLLYNFATGANASVLQMEPQDLKIKQEVVSMEQQQRPPSVDPLQSLKEVKVPGYSNTSISQPLLPTTSASVALNASLETHPTSGSRSNTNSPFMGNVCVDEIKKESECYAPASAVAARVTTPLKSPNLATAGAGAAASTKIGSGGSSSSSSSNGSIGSGGGDPSRSMSSSSPPPAGMKLSHTPPYATVGQQSLVSQSSATSTRTPTSSPLSGSTLITSSSTSGGQPLQPQPPSHSSHQSQPTLPPPMPPPQSSPLQRTSPAHLAHPHPYMPSMHQHYFQHPLFAATAAAQVAHAMHHQYPHSPYPGYAYGFPYPTPYPIPQPIPPPRPIESGGQKREADGGASTTLLTSHHSSSLSSSVTTRSLRDDDSNVHSQEITQTHHHSSSHHSSIHHHNDKQTISHSSSSSSSASVQHKVKRSSSPQVNFTFYPPLRCFYG